MLSRCNFMSASGFPAHPMNIFQCQHCAQPLYFENSLCQGCGRRLGFLQESQTVSALEPAGDEWQALTAPEARYRFCANAAYEACNWLVPAASGEAFCAACRHNRTIPDLSQAENVARWRRLELAKRRFFYTLLKLGLPLATSAEDPEGLAFDFLADPAEGQPQPPTILSGHERGLITISLTEADDAERERRRRDMREPYRTLIGHLRHEIGHYYWDRLVRDGPALARFRALFGDERADYGEALKAHYANGPPVDWRDHFITGYASVHPWEDFAETWAHYMHIVDTLETASAFGLKVRPKYEGAGVPSANVDFAAPFDPYRAEELDGLIAAWLPVTFAVNSLNRSMGQPDLYPFVLSPPAIIKLAFVHDLIRSARTGVPGRRAAGQDLKAVAAALKARVGAPDDA
jgi:hypothetical protein